MEIFNNPDTASDILLSLSFKDISAFCHSNKEIAYLCYHNRRLKDKIEKIESIVQKITLWGKHRLVFYKPIAVIDFRTLYKLGPLSTRYGQTIYAIEYENNYGPGISFKYQSFGEYNFIGNNYRLRYFVENLLFSLLYDNMVYIEYHI